MGVDEGYTGNADPAIATVWRDVRDMFSLRVERLLSVFGSGVRDARDISGLLLDGVMLVCLFSAHGGI